MYGLRAIAMLCITASIGAVYCAGASPPFEYPGYTVVGTAANSEGSVAIAFRDTSEPDHNLAQMKIDLDVATGEITVYQALGSFTVAATDKATQSELLTVLAWAEKNMKAWDAAMARDPATVDDHYDRTQRTVRLGKVDYHFAVRAGGSQLGYYTGPLRPSFRYDTALIVPAARFALERVIPSIDAWAEYAKSQMREVEKANADKAAALAKIKEKADAAATAKRDAERQAQLEASNARAARDRADDVDRLAERLPKGAAFFGATELANLKARSAATSTPSVVEIAREIFAEKERQLKQHPTAGPLYLAMKNKIDVRAAKRKAEQDKLSQAAWDLAAKRGMTITQAALAQQAALSQYRPSAEVESLGQEISAMGRQFVKVTGYDYDTIVDARSILE